MMFGDASPYVSGRDYWLVKSRYDDTELCAIHAKNDDEAIRAGHALYPNSWAESGYYANVGNVHNVKVYEADEWQTSKHYSVDYTKVSKLTFEDELPDTVSDTAYFDTEAEAKAFIRKLREPNDYWELKWCCLNTSETYIG